MESEKPTKDFSYSKASSILYCSLKLTAIFFFTIVPLLFILSSPTSTATTLTLSYLHQWRKALYRNATKDLDDMNAKLQDSVTFLPLKDLRFANKPMEGHTWFMSSLNDTFEEGETQHIYFPSETSKGRLLCINGRNQHDGSMNSYGLAWPGSLPSTATLLPGLTFVSDTYYDHENLWHGLCAVTPFVGWHMKNQCREKPTRWVLFHQGEVRTRTGSWVQNIMRATFEEEMKVEYFNQESNSSSSYKGAYCFEKAVVMRHNEGKMGQERRLKVYNMLRCKTRQFCNMDFKDDSTSSRDKPVIRLTLLMRKGARSFKNESAVIQIFKRECERVENCKLTVAQSENLGFCDQVKLLSSTDIVATPHGAQLTNMVFMDRNSSVMEFFPKGWLKHAGVGQYVFQWLASWAGISHEGAWWDPNGESCPYPENDFRCFTEIYKNGRVGYNESYFADWARRVIDAAKAKKQAQASNLQHEGSSNCECS
ncbi:hypothetical protein Syun_025095 [Stephania yunnanensis]|uniref:Glycosyltransferase 61 catalytic domain-containing protein n=1 Tax=Stephania yunnanensis TaxID=152371 RepID=A0AAP0EQZ6_9MAGN